MTNISTNVQTDWLGASYMNFLHKYCQIDILSRSTNIKGNRSDGYTKSIKNTTRLRWPQLIFMVYLISVIHICFYMYWQYVHDFGLLINLNSRSTAIGDDNQADFMTEKVKTYANPLEGSLNNAGALPSRWPFVNQILLLFCLLVTSVVYLLGCVWFNQFANFDAYLLKQIYNSTEELEMLNCLMKRRINLCLAAKETAGGFGPMYDKTPPLRLDCFIKQERFLPPSLTPSWKQWRWDLIRAINKFNMVYSIQIDSTVLSAMIYLIDMDKFKLNLISLLYILEIIFVIVTSNVAVSFYYGVELFSCIDQIKLSQTLKCEFIKCIENNTKVFERIKRLKQNGLEPTQPTNQQVLLPIEKLVKTEMNTNLLIVIVHYQIFVIQARRLKACLKFIFVGTIIIMFTSPITVRIHMPYFDAENDKTIRLALAVASVGFIVPADLCLVPMCILRSKFLKLYKTIYIMLAHCARVQNELQLYEPRLISILLAELDRPQGIYNMYGSKYELVQYTYPTLLRLHFYFGLIITAIVCNHQQHNESQTNMFNKVLGFF